VILLADSNVFARNLLSRELTREGYYILAASNCEEVLRLSSSFEGAIHLLLANCDMTGRAVFSDAVIRDRPKTPVLLISARTHENLVERTRERVRWSETKLPEQVRIRVREAITGDGRRITEI